MVRALIEAGANSDSRMPSGAATMHLAAAKGHLGVMRELIRAKANPSLIDTGPSGNHQPTVPLDAAAKHGHSDIVRELVQ